MAWTEDTTLNEDSVMIPNSTAAVPAASAPVAPEAEARQETLLSSGTVYTGDLRTTDNVLLHGRIEGNLVSTGEVRITGSIKGDLSAGEFHLLGGTVEGNLTITGTANVEKGSTIVGNIHAGAINLRAGTTLTGDISAKSICIEPGAALHGKLDIVQD